METKKKVIIIGAGPAGLTAGCELLRRSDEYEVLILEEEPVPGGISKTILSDGNRMDLGGHRFFSKNQQVMDWWIQLLPVQGAPSFDDKVLKREHEEKEGGPDPEKEDLVFLKRQRISRIYYNQKFFDYPIKMNWNTIRNMGFLTTVQAGLSYIKTLFWKHPEQSLEDFYINRFGKKLYSMFFEDYTEKLWGRHPSEISPDWGAQRVKGLSIVALIKDVLGKLIKKENRNVETSLIESFYYPKFGPGQLWQEAARQFETLGGKIDYGCKVSQVLQKENHITDVIFVKEGKTEKMEADILLSSMPLCDLIGGMNQVPESIQQIAKGLPYRDFVTVGLLVDRLKIKNETSRKTLGDIVPDCWIYVQDRSVRMGRIQIFNNWSPYMVEKPEQTVWLGLEYFCREGDPMWSMTEEEWKEFGFQELVQMGVADKDTKVLHAHCEKVKKAYPAYFDTYQDIKTLENWIDQVDNLYCIGRNGQHRYNNMDHSMLTAFLAVNLILSHALDHSSLWNINTEKEYHEEKGAEKK